MAHLPAEGIAVSETFVPAGSETSVCTVADSSGCSVSDASAGTVADAEGNITADAEADTEADAERRRDGSGGYSSYGGSNPLKGATIVVGSRGSSNRGCYHSGCGSSYYPGYSYYMPTSYCGYGCSSGGDSAEEKRNKKCAAISKKDDCDKDDECKFESSACKGKSDKEVKEDKEKKCGAITDETKCGADSTCKWDKDAKPAAKCVVK